MTLSKPITEFNAYVAALASHDWYFEDSSDQSVWRRGRDSARALATKAAMNDLFLEALYAYTAAAMDISPSLLERIEIREKKIDELRNKVLNSQLIAA